MNQEGENKPAIDLSKYLAKSSPSSREENRSSEYIFLPGTPKIIRWVIKYSGGLIKNEKEAFYAILGFVVIAFVIIFYLVLSKAQAPKSIPSTEYTPYERYGGKQLPDEFR